MAGYFNMVLDKIKDKTTVKKDDWGNRQTILAKFVNSTGMKDAWRELKGDENKFTFYSSVHKSYSRIDHIFVSQSLISKIDNIEIGMIRISDHATVSIDIQVEKNYKEAKRWRMN